MILSIIIPAYNEEKLIGRCLQSILDANFPVEYEIIVVNNASTDNTKKIAKSFKKVKVIDEKNKGLTKARQAGYNASKGDIIVYFDADSIIPKNWFEKALEIYNNDSKIVGVSGPYEYEDLNWFEKLFYINIPCIIFNLPFQKSFLLGGNFSVKREIIEKIGGFDTSIEFYGEDTNLSRRVSKYGKIKFSKDLLIISSPRRLKGQGRLKTLMIYISNFFSEKVLKRPLNRIYKDIR